jgi:acyl carrier protein
VRDALLALRPGERGASLQRRVRETVGRIVKLPPGRIDPGRPLGTFGLDSLMAQELRNRLEGDLLIRLSATLVWNYPTVNDLTVHLAETMGIALNDESVGAATPAAGPGRGDGADPAVVSAVGALSEDEALAQLMGRR